MEGTLAHISSEETSPPNPIVPGSLSSQLCTQRGWKWREQWTSPPRGNLAQIPWCRLSELPAMYPEGLEVEGTVDLPSERKPCPDPVVQALSAPGQVSRVMHPAGLHPSCSGMEAPVLGTPRPGHVSLPLTVHLCALSRPLLTW